MHKVSQKNIVFYIVLSVLILLTVYFGWKWLFSDSSGEAPFAIITGCLIPIVSYFKNWNDVHSKSKSLSTESKIEMPDLDLKITQKNIRCYTEDVHYGVQIQLEFFASRKVSIKSISLSCKEPYFDGNRKIENITVARNYKEDLLQYEINIFKEKLNATASIEVESLIIQESEHLFLTLIAFVFGERLSDSWEGLNLSGWRIQVLYNQDKEILQDISLDIHRNSLHKPIKYKAAGFKDA